ncbi:MAG TPA: Crp/Fnr family transcriptional regulator [Azospirillaceae bacterium]|nr:Crp/Fnr family transcriptional regulator [Azospirillaceae bacterium]
MVDLAVTGAGGIRIIDRAQALEGLGGCPLLTGVPAADVAAMEQASRWLAVPANTLVVRRDEPDTAVYFIVSGWVRIFHHEQQSFRVALAECGPGDLFGDLAAVDGRPRSADVETLRDSILVVCPHEVFLEAVQTHPSLAFAMLNRFAEIIRHSDHLITRLALYSGVKRVYQELLRLARPEALGSAIWIITPVPRHRDLALWAGTTTDVVGRALGQLMRNELLWRRGSALVLADRGRIEALTEESGEGAGGKA